MRMKLLVLAGVLVVAGVVVIALQPGPPDAECVAEGQPTSGFYDEEQDCAVSIESFEAIADHESSPKPWRIAGLVIVVAGVGVGASALVVGRRRGSGGPRA